MEPYQAFRRNGHAQQQRPDHPRGYKLSSRELPSQITNLAEDT
ncbi:MAG: hypothetical protein ACJA0Z_003766 [Halioglobus sp.]